MTGKLSVMSSNQRRSHNSPLMGGSGLLLLLEFRLAGAFRPVTCVATEMESQKSRTGRDHDFHQSQIPLRGYLARRTGQRDPSTPPRPCPASRRRPSLCSPSGGARLVRNACLGHQPLLVGHKWLRSVLITFAVWVCCPSVICNTCVVVAPSGQIFICGPVGCEVKGWRVECQQTTQTTTATEGMKKRRGGGGGVGDVFKTFVGECIVPCRYLATPGMDGCLRTIWHSRLVAILILQVGP